MKIFSSILIVLGLLVLLGGIAGVAVQSKSGGIRIGVGIVMIIAAIAIRPKSVTNAPVERKRRAPIKARSGDGKEGESIPENKETT